MFDIDNNQDNTLDNGTVDSPYSSEPEKEYEYGISYSSSKEKSLPVPKENKNEIVRNKAPWYTRTASVTVVLTLAMVIVSIISAFVGAKIAETSFQERNESSLRAPATSQKVNLVISKNENTSPDPTLGSAHGSTLTKKDVNAIASPSVVEIQTETVSQGVMFGQYTSNGAGSGVIIGRVENTNEYYIVTNDHVIDGASKISVILNDGTELNSKLVATDSDSDLAIVTVKSDAELVCATIGSSGSLAVGEDVVAIGNPLGKLGGSLTDGIISALERKVVIGDVAMTLLQTNVAVNPGNSGGGLFNMAGELVGIINAKYSDYDVEGLAFAIPSDEMRRVVSQLLEYGYVMGRPSLGIDMVERVSSHYGMISQSYVLVSDPGNNDDIKANDLIYKIDGYEVSTLSDIKLVVSQKQIGDKVMLTIYRNKTLIEIEVTLVEYIPGDGSLQFAPDA